MVNNWNRPKIKIPKTTGEWVWDIIGIVIYLCSVFFLIFVWNTLPEEVPAHYNAVGEVDRWGSKMELLILLAVGLFTFVMMQVFERFPEMHNYPSRMNESNAEQFYLHSRKLLNQLKNICLIIFALILVESISIALGWWDGFGVWFMPIILGGTFIPIIIGLIRQSKIK
ncbi:DUF1648 domain-containing protein [Niallia sp. Krafla_26]|uniref:DUF1648 domain-containing protein n=1 Tax=Niallia sp. Krafla_26 TaxID=3064703 RepID=UPI003D17C3E7